MTWVLIIIGALCGVWVAGFPGLVLGLGLGWGLALLLELRTRLDRLERTGAFRAGHLSRPAPAPPAAGRTGEAVRYPETTVLDAQRAAQEDPAAAAAEMDDLYREVSGGKEEQ